MITCQPLSFDLSRNFIRFLVEQISTNSKAPAEAFATVGDSGAEFLEQMMTLLHPKKRELLSNAPTFIGSTTSSKASTQLRA